MQVFWTFRNMFASMRRTTLISQNFWKFADKFIFSSSLERMFLISQNVVFIFHFSFANIYTELQP